MAEILADSTKEKREGFYLMATLKFGRAKIFFAFGKLIR